MLNQHRREKPNSCLLESLGISKAFVSKQKCLIENL